MSLGPSTRLDRAIALIGDHRVTVVEAGYGFGKTALVADAVANFAGAVHELGTIAQPIELPIDETQPSLIVIDEAEALSESQLREIEAAMTRAKGSRWLIVGRVIADPLRRHADQLLGSAELAFSTDDVELLLRRHDLDKASALASILIDSTFGWPLAIGRLMHSLSQVTDKRRAVTEVTRRAADDVGLVDPLLRDLDESAHRLLVIGSRLPWFDEHIISLLGHDAGMLLKARVVGVPIDAHHGRSRIHPAVSHRLARRPLPELGDDVVDSIASYVAAQGNVIDGLDVCIALGNHQSAAAIVAELSPHHRMAVDIDELNARLLIIDHTLDTYPRALLFQSLIHFDELRLDAGAQILDRAEAAAQLDESSATTEQRHTLSEVLVEQAFWAYIRGSADESASRLEHAERIIDQLDAATKVRAAEVRAGLSSLRGDRESLETAAEQLGEVIEYWRGQGDIARVASARMRLAIHILEPLGRPTDALRVLNDAKALPTLPVRDRARVQVFRARVLPFIGDFDEAASAAEDALQLAEFSDFGWAEAMAHWALAVIGSCRRDVESTTSHLRLAAKAMGELIDYDTGTIFCAEAAEACARCGEPDLAREWLDRIADDDQPASRLARASVEARYGDHVSAEAVLVELVDIVEPGNQWRAELLRSLCAQRRGDTAAVARHRATALKQASECGIARAPEFIEAHVLAQVGGQTPSSTPVRAADHGVSLTLFGPFRVCVDGDETRVIGHAATLLKLLAVGRASIKVDQAIDAMWPDADPATGKRRLRNVISRCHKALGRSAVERISDTLILQAHVGSDFGAAIELADRAVRIEPGSASATQAAMRAMPAVELLLADDRYDDWAEDVRARYASLRSQVFDLHQSHIAAG